MAPWQKRSHQFYSCQSPPSRQIKVLICILSGLGYGPNQVIVNIVKNTLGYASSSFLKEQTKKKNALLELPGSPGKIFIYPSMSRSLFCAALTAGDWGKGKHFRMLPV